MTHLTFEKERRNKKKKAKGKNSVLEEAKNSHFCKRVLKWRQEETRFTSLATTKPKKEKQNASFLSLSLPTAVMLVLSSFLVSKRRALKRRSFPLLSLALFFFSLSLPFNIVQWRACLHVNPLLQCWRQQLLPLCCHFCRSKMNDMDGKNLFVTLANDLGANCLHGQARCCPTNMKFDDQRIMMEIAN